MRSNGHIKYFFDESVFEKINDEMAAYWFGFICADGHVSKTGYQLSFCIQRRDKAHIEKFANLFGLPVRDYSTKDKRTGTTYLGSRCVVSSKKLVSDLESKGLQHNKSTTLGASPFQHVPTELLHHFIRGYFDGDGCIARGNEQQYRATVVGTRAFMDRCAREITAQAGLPTPNTEKHGRKLWAITYGGNHLLKTLSGWLYDDATIYLERKHQKFKNIHPGHDHKTSRFFGVHWCNQKRKYVAKAMHNGMVRYLGAFESEIEAARAYDSFATDHGLHLYKINFPTA